MMRSLRHVLAPFALVLALGCSSTPKPDPNPPTNETTSESPVEQTPQACSTDADCRIFSDYCTGCDCRALAKADPDPTCDGPGVRCVADPCMNKTAACEAGACGIRDAGTTAP